MAEWQMKWFMELERNHVHKVYDKIAQHFAKTRYRIWPGVRDFLQQKTSPCDIILDVGCGNGKNLWSMKNIYSIGIDRCLPLVQTCHPRETAVADMLELPFQSGKFDIVICIAVLHHLATRERRILAIKELARVLRPGGSCLIYVWAADDEGQTVKNTKAREKMRFLDDKKQDVLIPWVVVEGKTNNKTTAIQEEDLTVERYYHLYVRGELEEECLQSNCFHIQHSYFEQSNWCVVLNKP